MKTKECCICKKNFKGFGNNASPISDGECCDECNLNFVIPSRLKGNHLKGINKSVTYESPKEYIFTDDVFFESFGIKDNDRLRNYQLTKLFWEAKMNSLSADDMIGKEQMSLLKVMWNNSFKASMNSSMGFVIDEDVIPMLLNTHCENGELPFPNIFIDAKIEMRGRTYFGFHVGSYYTEKGTKYKAILTVYAQYLKRKGEDVKILIPDFILLKKNSDEKLPFREKDYYHSKIKDFIFSFCAFVNEPDVSVIEHPINPKNNERRIKKGNLPLPAYKRIKISGKLRLYVNKQNSYAGSHKHLGYRFWVRGFYRHFFNKKKYHLLYMLSKEDLRKAGLTYSEKHKGILRKWVKPYIKGQGILIKQSWEVKD